MWSVFVVSLLGFDLPAHLENERPVLTREVQAGVQEVVDTFERWGFPLKEAPLIERVQVFDDVTDLKTTLAKHTGMAEELIPATFAGMVDQKTLFLVTPRLYRTTWEDLYPSFAWDANTYRRLIVHEAAHAAHARIATDLHGTEDGMGPQWFFEGLACYAAGQFKAAEPFNRAQFSGLLAKIDEGKGRVSYVDYARLVKTLALSVPVGTLMRHAPDPGFPRAFLDRIAP